MSWAPNPIALARTLVGADGKGRGWPGSWAEAEALLGEAFNADAQSVFYGRGRKAALIDVVRRIAARVRRERSLEHLLGLPEVRAFAAHVRHEEALARVLPFIVPVKDAAFGPPGTGFRLLGAPPPIGDYEHIGALDVAGVSWLDPEQGNVADCYLIAAMIAIAWARPVRWLRRLSEGTQGARDAGNLHVKFFSADMDEFGHPRPFDVPPKVPLDTGHNWIYAHSAQSEETWPALLERAFVMQASGNKGEPTVDDYRAIGNGSWPWDAARALLGGTTQRSGERTSHFADLSEICEASLTRFPTMASTHSRGERNDWIDSGLVDDHAYAVLGVLARGGRDFVVLRNPYGKNAHCAHFARGEWSEGAPRNRGQPVALGEHGVFALGAKAFDHWFAAIGWVEVPRDPPMA